MSPGQRSDGGLESATEYDSPRILSATHDVTAASSCHSLVCDLGSSGQDLQEGNLQRKTAPYALCIWLVLPARALENRLSWPRNPFPLNFSMIVQPNVSSHAARTRPYPGCARPRPYPENARNRPKPDQNSGRLIRTKHLVKLGVWNVRTLSDIAFGRRELLCDELHRFGVKIACCEFRG